MSDRIKWKKLKKKKKNQVTIMCILKRALLCRKEAPLSVSPTTFGALLIFIQMYYIYAVSHNSESTFSLFSTEKCLSLQEYFLRIPTVYLQLFLQNSKKSRRVKIAFKSTKCATCSCTTVRTVIYHNLS